MIPKSDPHHSFSVELASIYGLEEAIIIHHFQHWIEHNQRTGKNYHEGRTWSYQTIDDIAAWFPYLTIDQVRNIIYRLEHGRSRFSESDELEFEPVLISGNFNRSKIDKTKWYAFKNEKMFTKGGSTKWIGESARWTGSSTTPIPDTKTDTETIVCFGNGPVGQEKIESQEEKIFYKTSNHQHLAISIADLKQHLSQFSLKSIELTIEELRSYGKPITDIHKLSLTICRKKQNTLQKESRNDNSNQRKSLPREDSARRGYFINGKRIEESYTWKSDQEIPDWVSEVPRNHS